jgi:hypothetical protein
MYHRPADSFAIKVDSVELWVINVLDPGLSSGLNSFAVIWPDAQYFVKHSNQMNDTTIVVDLIKGHN